MTVPISKWSAVSDVSTMRNFGPPLVMMPSMPLLSVLKSMIVPYVPTLKISG